MDMCMVTRAFLVPVFLLVFFESNLFGKVLKCPQIELLNIALENMPYVLARLKLSSKGTMQVSNTLMAEAHGVNKGLSGVSKEDEKKFIQAQLKLILEPVKEFFTEICAHVSLVKPLFEESICGAIGSKSPHSYLIEFIESSLDLFTFFAQSIDTKDELKLVCEEFKTFLTDIDDSLSVEAKQKYEKFIRDIKAKKLQGKSANTKEDMAAVVAGIAL